MLGHLVVRPFRLVRPLVPQVRAPAGYSPVAVATREPPLVELQVVRIARVTEVRRPYVAANLLVTEESYDRWVILECIADEVRGVGGLRPTSLVIGRAPADPLEQPVPRLPGTRRDVHRQGVVAAVEHVVIDEEELDAVVREQLLNARPEDQVAASSDRRRLPPLAPWTVGALGQPEPPRPPPHEPLEGGDALADLSQDTGVFSQEREVTVSGRGAGHLDVALLVEFPEGSQNVALQVLLVEPPHRGEVLLPAPCQMLEMPLAQALPLLLVPRRRVHTETQVVQEPMVESLIRKLLHDCRGNPECHIR